MHGVALTVAEASQISAARMEAQRRARELGFDETQTGQVAIAVTEAATNVLRHAGGGMLVVQALQRGASVGIEVIAIDHGPGMRDFSHSAQDGVSTAGTAGTGLGAMRRLSHEFDVYTRQGAGSIMRMAFWSGGRPAERDEGYEVGAVCVPKAGETANGDAWGIETGRRGMTLLVADGLGHGPDAARASALAVEVLRRNPEAAAVRMLDAVHAKLRATRGAAVAVIHHERRAASLEFAGVGNISGTILDGTGRRSMVSHNGIVGQNVHKSEEYHYPWPRDALLVAHSDGLESHWSLERFPGATRCHPSIVAALLYRENWRKRDDVVVVVARRTE